MSADVDEDVHNGWAVDPTVVLGPRAGSLYRQRPAIDDSSDTYALPIAGSKSQGASASAASKLPSLEEFGGSAMGWLLVLLGVGYVAFHYTFGVGSR